MSQYIVDCQDMLSSLFWRSATPVDPQSTLDDRAYAEQLICPRGWNPTKFDSSSQVRVLLCHDSSLRGKCPLFDTHMKPLRNQSVPSTERPSSHAVPVSYAASMPNVNGNFPSKGHKSSPRKQPFHAQSSDLDLIGEMMFGAVPLTYRGVTTKIHYLRFPSQLLITKLFSFSPSDFHTQLPTPSGLPVIDNSLTGITGNVNVGLATSALDTSFSAANSASQSQDIGYTSPTPSSLSSPGISIRTPSVRGNMSPRARSRAQTMSISPSNSIVNDGLEVGSAALFDVSPGSAIDIKDDDASEGRRVRTQSNASDLAAPASLSYSARRYMRHRSTSIENGTFHPSPLPTSSSSSFREHSSSISSSPQQHRHRRLQFALGIVVNVDNNKLLRDLIFSHFALIEFRIHKMYDGITSAVRGALRSSVPQLLLDSLATISTDDLQQHLLPFVFQTNEVIIAAVAEFRSSLRSLYHVPRIHEPLWLNLITFPSRRPHISRELMRELSFLFEAFDSKKQTNFLATLLTAVLSHHLAWVPTVAPPPPGIQENDEMAISRYFPYNPLWAQLSDLYGSIGSPAHVARTIVVGHNVAWVNRLLFVLTYFIRCSEVFESTEHLDEPTRISRLHSKRPDDIEKDSGHGESVSPTTPDHGQQSFEESTFMASGINIVSLLDTFRMGESALPWQKHGLDDHSLPPSISFPNTQNNSTKENEHSTPTQPSPSRSRGSSRITDEGIARSRQNSHPDDLSAMSSPRSNSVNSFGTSPNGHAQSPFSLLPARTVAEPTPQVAEAHRQAFGAVLGDDKYEGLHEIPMPRSQTVRVFPNTASAMAGGLVNYRSEQMFCRTYGRSLLGGYYQRYVPDLVLMGLPQLDFMEDLIADLKLSVMHRVLDEPVFRSVCIIADTNEWRCEQITSSVDEVVDIDPETLTPRRAVNSGMGDVVSVTQRQPQPSDFIISTLTSLKGLFDLGMSPEACVMHLEDRLQELYFKSVLLSEFVNEHMDQTLTYRSVSTKLGLSMSDLPLLVAIASTHHPNIGLRFKISEQLLMIQSRDYL